MRYLTVFHRKETLFNAPLNNLKDAQRGPDGGFTVMLKDSREYTFANGFWSHIVIDDTKRRANYEG